MHDTLRNAAMSIVEERCDDPVRASVVRLATPPRKPLVEIGTPRTGKREFHWDSRSGRYSEEKPLVGYDAWLIQMALVPGLLVQRRHKKDIRQKE